VIGRPLWITLKYLLRGIRRRPATVLYPLEKVRLPYQSRGLHKLDDEKCTGCGACSRACPNVCIDMVQVAEKKKRPGIDIGRCLFCGYCVDVCPFGAMHMTGNYELAVFSRKELLMTPEMLMKVEDTREGTLDEELWKRVYGKDEIPAWPPLPEKPGKGKKDTAKKEDVKAALPDAGTKTEPKKPGDGGSVQDDDAKKTEEKPMKKGNEGTAEGAK